MIDLWILTIRCWSIQWDALGTMNYNQMVFLKNYNEQIELEWRTMGQAKIDGWSLLFFCFTSLSHFLSLFLLTSIICPFAKSTRATKNSTTAIFSLDDSLFTLENGTYFYSTDSVTNWKPLKRSYMDLNLFQNVSHVCRKRFQRFHKKFRAHYISLNLFQALYCARKYLYVSYVQDLKKVSLNAPDLLWLSEILPVLHCSIYEQMLFVYLFQVQFYRNTKMIVSYP